MKLIKYTALCLLISASMASCDFLDKEPMKLAPENYFNNEEEASSFLTGIYAELGQSTFYGCDYMYLVGGDDLSHFGGSGRAPATRGLICNNTTTSDPAVTGFWYTLYNGINRANMFLKNIEEVSSIDAGTKNRYIAEARFLRAFYYFNLVQCWGDVPFFTEPTETVVGLDKPRTNKQTIYDFIVKEMDEVSDEQAGGLLTAAELSNKPGHVSKDAAWGMLARVCLFRAGEHYRDNRTATSDETSGYFAKASEYGQKVIKAGHKLAPNYWDYFIDLCANEYNTTANESLWEAEFAGNNTTDVKAEGRIGNVIGITAPDLSNKSTIVGKGDPGYGYGFIYSTPKLYELYKANGDLKRFYWNIAPFAYQQAVSGGAVTGRQFDAGTMSTILNDFNNWGERTNAYGEGNATAKTGDFENAKESTNYAKVCAKFRREYEADKKDKNSTAINFPILRYADVLLMVAEAENEVNGPNELAYKCINEVRIRAGLTSLSGLSKEEFRQAVKDERAMELCFEYTRHFDLIRWGEFAKNMNALVSRAQAGENWTLGPSNVYTYFQVSNIYNYFPIPDAEISVNKKITQNPGW